MNKDDIFIAGEYDVIVIEDLKTKDMMHNHHLARAIANAGWSEFAGMLEYKCAFYGKTLIKTDPAYTSQTCSACGEVNNRLGYNHYGWLKVRECVSSFLADPFNMAECGADVMITGSQKVLACPPGISIIVFVINAVN